MSLYNTWRSHNYINDKSATSKLQENMHTTSSVLAESKQTEKTSPILNIGDVDGYMATWIEFLLLARASPLHQWVLINSGSILVLLHT